VRVALDAAQQDGLAFPAALAIGPSGCGKSQTAKIIAAEMAADFHEVLGQAIQSPADFNAFSRELAQAVGQLSSKYDRSNSRSSRPFRIVIGAHPAPKSQTLAPTTEATEYSGGA